MMPIQNSPQRQPLRFGVIPWLVKQDSPEFQRKLKQGRVGIAFVDGLNDFFDRDVQARQGLPIANSSSIIPNLGKVWDAVQEFNDFAARNRGRILRPLTTLFYQDSHHPDSFEFPWFNDVSDGHCVKGTDGWKFIPEIDPTGKNPLRFEIEPSTEQPDFWTHPAQLTRADIAQTKRDIRNAIAQGRPIIVEKDGYSLVLGNPKGRLILDSVRDNGVDTMVDVGVATDYCNEEAVTDQEVARMRPLVVPDAMMHVAADLLSDPDHQVYGTLSALSTDRLVQELQKAQVKSPRKSSS